MRYVALGDSYTIGTSVAEAERWPNQLVERNRDIELVANLAVNGFTSRDVITEELPQLDDLGPELVSLLIGVNDVVQGVADSEYAGNVTVILEDLVNRLARDRIFCVATPDYTVTPRGEAFGDPIQQSDYYALYGIFQSTKYAFPGTEIYRLPQDLTPLVSKERLE